MITSDVTLQRTDGWRSVTCTGTVIHIKGIYNMEISVRFGIDSTSSGFALVPGDELSANETVYVRLLSSVNSMNGSFTITKD
jgi:hypothetical protein